MKVQASTFSFLLSFPSSNFLGGSKACDGLLSRPRILMQHFTILLPGVVFIALRNGGKSLAGHRVARFDLIPGSPSGSFWSMGKVCAL